MSTEKKGIVNFGKTSINDFQLPLLAELEDKVFVIQSIRWGQAMFGQYAVVETNLGTYRTTGKVILVQLKEAEKMLTEVSGVRVKLIKKNRYFTFVQPDIKEKE